LNTNHIIVKVENHIFLKMFPVRIILNEKLIYTTKEKEAIEATIETDNVVVQVTNGYHFIKPITVKFTETNVIGIRVETYLSNERIGSMVILTLVLFFAAYIEKSTIVKIVANLPFLLLMLYAFFNKNKILLISSLQKESYKEKYYKQYES
jgi:hypothetical protein